MTATQTLFVVDDDDAVRRALVGVGALLDVPVKSFAAADEFLEAFTPEQSGCLVLDVKMPRMTGLELQRVLADRGVRLPVVMISGHADVRVAVEAMTLGAVTLLEKPFSLEELLRSVRRGLALDLGARETRTRQSDARAKIESLTAKEREVVDRIAGGQSNRDIAVSLNLSLRAVEDRRARVMKKLGLTSPMGLLKMVRDIEFE
jgi:FixJ family two-component response regulator